jgi:hypothetical protein
MQASPQQAFDPYHTWLGIPPEEQPPNHYRLLGVGVFESRPDVIASAADRQMGHLRTFQSGKHSVLSQQLLNEVATAKVCLLHPAKKAAYDNQLRQSQAGTPEDDVSVSANPSDWLPTGDKSATAHHHRATTKRSTQLGPALAVVGTSVLLVVGLLVWNSARQAGRAVKPHSVARDVKGEEPTLSVAGQSARQSKPDVRKTVGEPGVPSASHRGSTAPAGESSVGQTELRTLKTPATPVNKSPGPAADGVAMSFSEAVAQLAKSPPVADKPVAKEPAAEKGAEKPTQPDSGSARASGAKSKRLPVPDDATQIKIAKELSAVYDVAHVKTAAEKVALARQLLEAVQNTRSNPNEQFVLLQQATELAVGAGDAATMVDAVETLVEQFEVEQTDRIGKGLIECANNARSAEHIGSLVVHARRVVEQAALAGQYELALELADAMHRACQRSQGKEYRKEAAEQRSWVQEYCRVQKQRARAQAAVDADAQNAEAHLTLGRYYCFVEDDWKRGLPHLAKGTDAELKRMAELELSSPPSDPEEQVKLADAWWKLAQGREGTERDALSLRAGHWYELARSKLTSALVRLKVEKHLEELVGIRQRHVAGNERLLHSGKGSAQSLWSSPH